MEERKKLIESREVVALLGLCASGVGLWFVHPVISAWYVGTVLTLFAVTTPPNKPISEED